MKKILSLVLKILTFIFMVVGIIVRSLDKESMLADNNPLLYFTMQSNIWIGVYCLILFVIMLIEIKTSRKIYGRVLKIIKLVFTVSITITGFIYTVALAPGMGKDAWTFGNVVTHAVVPLLSILDFLKNVQASSADVYNFLCKMTTENETQKQLAKEFSANPRMSKSIHTFLLKKLGNDKKAHELFNSWYYDEKYGYRKAYERYYNEDIWANAQYFMDLVKQSPNVSTWALKCFCKEKNTEPILGVLPEYIGTRKDFTNLINELKIWHKNACKLKEKTKNKTVFDIPFEININNKTYNIKCLTSGHSPKLKFIFTIL